MEALSAPTPKYRVGVSVSIERTNPAEKFTRSPWIRSFNSLSLDDRAVVRRLVEAQCIVV